MGAAGWRRRSGARHARPQNELPAAPGSGRDLSGRRHSLDRLSSQRPLHSRDRHQSRSHPAPPVRSRDREGDANDAAAGNMRKRADPAARADNDMLQSVSPSGLKAMLADGQELAILDLREELIFSRAHPLWARSVPLSRLELLVPGLVPRRGTRIVLGDDADGLVERGAEVLRRFGYANLFFLGGGVAAWGGAGFELVSGVNVPSKAFGEFVEHAAGTPSIAAGELEQWLRTGADVVVLDSRPLEEYARMAIPTAINAPGDELVLRVHDIARSPQTMVVVNCAGRTRSIIGAQSLINAGLPNKVVALRNGTMGWQLAGFSCESGKSRRATHVSAG